MAMPAIASSRYNELEDVIVASQRLVRTGNTFEEYFSVLSRSAHELGAPDGLGVLLVHRHWRLEPGGMMVERRGSFRDRPALITAPEGQPATLCAPIRWVVDGEALVGMEYSDDPDAVAVSTALARHSRFIQTFIDITRGFGMADLCGLAVTRRTHLRCRDREFYLEFNGNNCSVVVATSLTMKGNDAIDTVWPFPTGPVAGCTSRCRQTHRTRCVRSGDQHRQVHDFDHVSSHEYTPICRPTGCV